VLHSGGREPVRVFMYRCSFSIAVRVLHEDGRVPEKLFVARYSDRSLSRMLNPRGSVPSSLASCKNSDVSLPSPSQVTYGQEHVAVDGVQPASRKQSGAWESLKSRRASRSAYADDCCCVGLGVGGGVGN